MPSMKKLVLAFNEDRYARVLIACGITGVSAGFYSLSAGLSPLLGIAASFGISYLFCGAFRIFFRMFDFREKNFTRSRLALLLLASYGLLVYATEHFVESYIPYSFANPACQFMAFVCAGLSLSLLMNPQLPSQNRSS